MSHETRLAKPSLRLGQTGPWRALLVANWRYHSLRCLEGPQHDLEVVLAGLRRFCHLEGEPKVLRNANYQQMLEELQKMWVPVQDANCQPLSFVFFAGHGYHTSKGTVLAAVDADVESWQGLILVEQLRQKFNRQQNGLLVLIAACCREAHEPLGVQTCPLQGVNRLERKPKSFGDFFLYSCRPAGFIKDFGQSLKLQCHEAMRPVSRIAAGFFNSFLLSRILRLPVLETLQQVREVCLSSLETGPESLPELVHALNRQEGRRIFLVVPGESLRPLRKCDECGYLPSCIFQTRSTTDLQTFWEEVKKHEKDACSAASLLGKAYRLYDVSDVENLTSAMLGTLKSPNISPHLAVLALAFLVPYSQDAEVRSSGLSQLLQLLADNEFDSFVMATGFITAGLQLRKEARNPETLMDAFYLMMRASDLHEQCGLLEHACGNKLIAWQTLLSSEQEDGVRSDDAMNALESLKKLNCPSNAKRVECDFMCLIAHHMSQIHFDHFHMEQQILCKFQHLQNTEPDAAERLKVRLRPFPDYLRILEVETP
eukprot:symbB.v1.2.032324.t1/scaffold3863.1/size49111/2